MPEYAGPHITIPIGERRQLQMMGPDHWLDDRTVDMIAAPPWITLLHRMCRLGAFDHRAGNNGRVVKFSGLVGIKANYPELKDVTEIWFVYRG